jgi:hypothetical protein
MEHLTGNYFLQKALFLYPDSFAGRLLRLGDGGRGNKPSNMKSKPYDLPKMLDWIQWTKKE